MVGEDQHGQSQARAPLHLQNPMHFRENWDWDWELNEEERQVNSQILQLHINGECIKTLKRADYNMWFGVDRRR